MRSLRAALAILISVAMVGVPAVAQANSTPLTGAHSGHLDSAAKWVLSRGKLAVGKDGFIGVKLNTHTVMWVGGLADHSADNNGCFLYDTRSQTHYQPTEDQTGVARRRGAHPRTAH